MATRPLRGAGQDAVDRARTRIPGLAPASAEVVELVRGVPYVVVRTTPTGVVVLDEGGRMVRRRHVLAAIAHHLDAVRGLAAAVTESHLDRRREHTERSIELLEPVKPAGAIVEGLHELDARIEAVLAATRAAGPPTERTLPRRVAELNEAARADRRVVREARLAGASLGCTNGKRRGRDDVLRRWVAVRLSSPDLPFFHPELGEAESARFVEDFLRVVRR